MTEYSEHYEKLQGKWFNAISTMFFTKRVLSLGLYTIPEHLSALETSQWKSLESSAITLHLPSSIVFGFNFSFFVRSISH